MSGIRAVAVDPTTPIGRLAAESTRFLFFTGKGGVGKTSVASAVAVMLADVGNRVLIVSTDPASNLDEVFEQELASEPHPIDGVPGLFAANIDPERAAAEYRERVVGPYRGVLPEAAVVSMEEQLSGACTVEIAAFNEFAALVGDPSLVSDFDVLVFDTAPTGHTLRLLTLPTAWTEFIDTNVTGASCLGPLAGLSEQRALYGRTVESLADAALTTLLLVSRPDASALREAARSSAELAGLGIANQRLVLNGIFEPSDPEDAIAVAMHDRTRAALAQQPHSLACLPSVEVPLLVASPLGVAGLRALGSAQAGVQQAPEQSALVASATPTAGACAQPTAGACPTPTAPASVQPERHATLADLVDELEAMGPGVVMTMGKGGVGKTTMAAALAAELARRGHGVHVSTTDPAAHIAEALHDLGTGIDVGRIDPDVEVGAYRDEVLARAGDSIDAQSLAMLEEDLRSPCTEEIAVFRAFARVVAQGAERYVILDTAPTGHTLLLLDASESYHREVLRTASDVPPEVTELLPRLRDPKFTRVLVVTLPEATPVGEASRLQQDLARAGIAPYAWVVNQSLSLVDTADPVLRTRAAGEQPFIRRVAEKLSTRTFVVPWAQTAPVGAAGLAALIPTRSEEGVL